MRNSVCLLKLSKKYILEKFELDALERTNFFTLRKLFEFFYKNFKTHYFENFKVLYFSMLFLQPIMDNNINSYYGENIEELTQKIDNDTMEQLQDIDMLDFYMTVSIMLKQFSSQTNTLL